MLELIWLLPTFPLLGFLALVLTGGTLPKQIAGPIGAGSIGLSFAVAALAAALRLDLTAVSSESRWGYLRQTAHTAHALPPCLP